MPNAKTAVIWCRPVRTHNSSAVQITVIDKDWPAQVAKPVGLLYNRKATFGQEGGSPVALGNNAPVTLLSCEEGIW